VLVRLNSKQRNERTPSRLKSPWNRGDEKEGERNKYIERE